MKVRIEVGGHPFDVALEATPDGFMATVDGETFPIHVDASPGSAVVRAGPATHTVGLADAHHALVDGREVPISLLELHGVAGAAEDAAGGLGDMKPPMTGKLDALAVEVGQEVQAGDVLFVLEAMKMRNEVRSPADAVVLSIDATPGDAVDTSTTIMVLGPASPPK